MRTAILAALSILTITPAFADGTDCGPSVDRGTECTIQIKAGEQKIIYLEPGEKTNEIIGPFKDWFETALVKGGPQGNEVTAVVVLAKEPKQKGSIVIGTDRGFREITLVSE